MLSEGEQNRLIIEYGGLVEPIAANYRGQKGIPFEDLVATGHVGLVSAARRYDSNLSRFQTYATHNIHSAILHFIRDWQGFDSSTESDGIERDWVEWQIWPHIAPYENWTTLAATPEEILSRYREMEQKQNSIAAALLGFPKREREIVSARFLRDPPKTLAAIAQDHKISYARVVFLLDRTLSRMAKIIGAMERKAA